MGGGEVIFQKKTLRNLLMTPYLVIDLLLFRNLMIMPVNNNTRKKSHGPKKACGPTKARGP